MVVVKGFHLFQIFECLVLVAQTIVAEGKHILAVDKVLRVERVLPYQQVGQRHSEVVHDWMLEDVLFAVVDELMEQATCFVLLT